MYNSVGGSSSSSSSTQNVCAFSLRSLLLTQHSTEESFVAIILAYYGRKKAPRRAAFAFLTRPHKRVFLPLPPPSPDQTHHRRDILATSDAHFTAYCLLERRVGIILRLADIARDRASGAAAAHRLTATNSQPSTTSTPRQCCPIPLMTVRNSAPFSIPHTKTSTYTSSSSMCCEKEVWSSPPQPPYAITIKLGVRIAEKKTAAVRPPASSASVDV